MKKLTALLAGVLWCAAAHAQSSLTIVNAASNGTTAAPDSLVTAFGTGLATQTFTATSLPLPTTLGGDTVQVTDSTGTARQAAMVFLSSTQVNFILPAGTASGTAKVVLNNGSTAVASGTIAVQAVAPGIFSASGDGKGVAAALAIRVIDVVGPQTIFPIFHCDPPFQNCTALPVALGVDTPVFLALFGTGIRGGKDVSVTVGGHSVPVLYAGAQGTFPGLDQVNIPIPLTLRNAGAATIMVTVDGQVSNTVQVLIQ